MTIYRYHPEYQEAKRNLEAASLEDHLKTIEALRQLEIEFRAEVDERATFYVEQAKLMKGTTQ